MAKVKIIAKTELHRTDQENVKAGKEAEFDKEVADMLVAKGHAEYVDPKLNKEQGDK